VRRFSAILLLALLSFSLLTPALASDSNSKLPACCRRQGKHHCATAAGGGAWKSGAGFVANARCRVYPAGAVLSTVASSAGLIPRVTSLRKPDDNAALATELSPADLPIPGVTSLKTRGPPHFLFLG